MFGWTCRTKNQTEPNPKIQAKEVENGCNQSPTSFLAVF